MRTSRTTTERTTAWTATLTWTDVDGRPECTAIAIVTPDGSPITAVLLRSIPVGAMVRDHRRVLATAPPLPPRQNRRNRLDVVADAYMAAWRRGEPPTKAVHAALGGPDAVSYSTAAHLVMDARATGLIPPRRSGPRDITVNTTDTEEES